jgi:hypothetical protein
MDASFYRDYPYTVLYELASAAGASHRVHYLVFNTDDSCCFAGESVESFRRYVRSRPADPTRDLRVMLVRNKGHHMMPDAVLDILKSLPGQKQAKSQLSPHVRPSGYCGICDRSPQLYEASTPET